MENLSQRAPPPKPIKPVKPPKPAQLSGKVAAGSTPPGTRSLPPSPPLVSSELSKALPWPCPPSTPPPQTIASTVSEASTPPPFPSLSGSDAGDTTAPQLSKADKALSMRQKGGLFTLVRGSSDSCQNSSPVRRLSNMFSSSSFVSKSYTDEAEATSRLADIVSHITGREVEDGLRFVDGNRLIREGFLEKTNRDGAMKLYFILTNATLTTCKGDSSLTGSNRLKHNRTIPLHSLLVIGLRYFTYQLMSVHPLALRWVCYRDAPEDCSLSNKGKSDGLVPMKGNLSSNEARDCTFLLMSKQKSYQVKAESVEERTLWFNDIAQAAREARVSTGSPELTPEDMSPVWIPDSHVTACEICCKEFSFFFRRHHCRNCGKCICENCFREKCRIPRLDERTLFKVCTQCAKELKAARKYGADG